MPNIYKHNSKGNYGNFYDTKYPCIIEFVLKDNENINTKLWNNIEINCDSKEYDSTSDEFYFNELGFFDKVIFYNEKQCTGQLDISIDNNKEEYFFDQSLISSSVEVEKNEGIWYLNNFRDYVNIKDKPFFTKNWDIIQDNFPIDKVINNFNYGNEENPSYVINTEKLWNEQERFRGRYLVIRFINSNNDENKQLVIKNIIGNSIESKR